MAQPERTQHSLRQESFPILAGRAHGDQPGDAAAGVGVAEGGARLELMGNVCQGGHVANERVVTPAVIGVRTVVHTGRHREQVSEGNALGGVAIGELEIGDPRFDRPIEVEGTLVDQAHDDGGVEQLRRRADLKQGVRGGRNIALLDCETGCELVNLLTVVHCELGADHAYHSGGLVEDGLKTRRIEPGRAPGRREHRAR